MTILISYILICVNILFLCTPNMLYPGEFHNWSYIDKARFLLWNKYLKPLQQPHPASIDAAINEVKNIKWENIHQKTVAKKIIHKEGEIFGNRTYQDLAIQAQKKIGIPEKYIQLLRNGYKEKNDPSIIVPYYVTTTGLYINHYGHNSSDYTSIKTSLSLQSDKYGCLLHEAYHLKYCDSFFNYMLNSFLLAIIIPWIPISIDTHFCKNSSEAALLLRVAIYSLPSAFIGNYIATHYSHYWCEHTEHRTDIKTADTLACYQCIKIYQSHSPSKKNISQKSTVYAYKEEFEPFLKKYKNSYCNTFHTNKFADNKGDIILGRRDEYL